MSIFDIFDWIKEELQPTACTSDTFIYDDMASQSGGSLPVIYRPFDAGKRSHWRDRGALFDYLFSTRGEGKTLLDFGPGDGWPSLIVAPYAREVVGVDASRRRVQVCAENAARLGLSNAHFVPVGTRTALPFAANTFDGLMAATSLEQTPCPQATLAELHRVLRPGGRLRMAYESLGQYRGGKEQGLWLWEISDQRCRLVLFDRHVEEEYVVQVGLTYALSAQQLQAVLGTGKGPLELSDITVAALQNSLFALVDARVCRTIHPSARTWMAWLHQAGFRRVLPSHSGSQIAGQLFDQLPAERRPQTVEALDAYLRPIVKVIVQMPAPTATDPMLTAFK